VFSVGRQKSMLAWTWFGMNPSQNFWKGTRAFYLLVTTEVDFSILLAI
jgi:hypothetical protein